jgi:hypothetical protein
VLLVAVALFASALAAAFLVARGLTTNLSSAELRDLRPALDAAVAARLGAPAPVPLVAASATQFTLSYSLPRGTLTFNGRHSRTPCAASVIVDRLRSSPSALAWHVARIHGCRG